MFCLIDCKGNVTWLVMCTKRELIETKRHNRPGDRLTHWAETAHWTRHRMLPQNAKHLPGKLNKQVNGKSARMHYISQPVWWIHQLIDQTMITSHVGKESTKWRCKSRPQKVIGRTNYDGFKSGQTCNVQVANKCGKMWRCRVCTAEDKGANWSVPVDISWLG